MADHAGRHSKPFPSWKWDAAAFRYIQIQNNRIDNVVGKLAESWDVTPERIKINIRPGIFWSGMNIEPTMEAREYVAQDYVWNLTRRLGMAGGSGVIAADFIKTPYEDSIYAEDKYTVIIETTRFHVTWLNDILHICGYQIAPESIEIGAGKWEHVVGTGAFAIKEFVPGSHIEYERNPNYWRTTTIDGVEYQLPFLDGFRMPLITEEVTALSAVRTGVLDVFMNATFVLGSELIESVPDLKSEDALADGVNLWAFRIDQPPLDNIEVRRALFMGTDLAGVSEAVMGADWIHAWPLLSIAEGHVPMEDLPASSQELFEYNPEKARQMLADAGYPNGFSMSVLSRSGIYAEVAEMVAGMWKQDLGIDLEIEVMDWTVMINHLRSKDWV